MTGEVFEVSITATEAEFSVCLDLRVFSIQLGLQHTSLTHGAACAVSQPCTSVLSALLLTLAAWDPVESTSLPLPPPSLFLRSSLGRTRSRCMQIPRILHSTRLSQAAPPAPPPSCHLCQRFGTLASGWRILQPGSHC